MSTSQQRTKQNGAAPDGVPEALVSEAAGLEGGEIALMDGEGDEAGARAATARPKVRGDIGRGVREIGDYQSD